MPLLWNWWTIFALSAFGEKDVSMPGEDTDDKVALYRKKAAEAREFAMRAPTIKMRASLMAIAESYERLAELETIGLSEPIVSPRV
jgi:hypothetical protein